MQTLLVTRSSRKALVMGHLRPVPSPGLPDCPSLSPPHLQTPPPPHCGKLLQNGVCLGVVGGFAGDLELIQTLQKKIRGLLQMGNEVKPPIKEPPKEGLPRHSSVCQIHTFPSTFFQHLLGKGKLMAQSVLYFEVHNYTTELILSIVA